MNLLLDLQFQLCSNNTSHSPHLDTFLFSPSKDIALSFQSLLINHLHLQSNFHVNAAIVYAPTAVLNQLGGMKRGIWLHYIANEGDFHQKKCLANACQESDSCRQGIRSTIKQELKFKISCYTINITPPFVAVLTASIWTVICRPRT